MKRIAIIGPESSGKSTLGQALAAAIGGRYIEEYARAYVEQLHRPYNYLDVLHIARVQYNQLYNIRDGKRHPSCPPQLPSLPPSPFPTHLIFDTDLIITKVWMEYKYGTCPAWIREALLPENNPIDLYLLCCPDLPFVPDPTREHPHEREALFQTYLQEVLQTNKPYTLIQGTEPAVRLAQAIAAVTS